MRVQGSVISVSWIPIQALEGLLKLPMSLGIGQYDQPPPDRLTEVVSIAGRSPFRFANELRGYIEVQDGAIADYGQEGRGHIRPTLMTLGGQTIAMPPVAFPDLRPRPVVGADSVRFTQTAGGRTGVPLPRRINHKPYIRIASPPAWTTLSLTLHADGSTEHELVGASPFPRHWVYGPEGQLTHKTAVISQAEWWRGWFPDRSPWGGEDHPALVRAVETSLERELSTVIVASKPQWDRLAADEVLVRQGDPGDDVFLLFDGIVSVEVDGEPVAEVGPGAVLGEMSRFSGGRRTATLRATTPCRIAIIRPEQLDPRALGQLAESRRRPDPEAG